MKKNHYGIVLSASDLVGHLNCRHLTALDLQVAAGTLPIPQSWDPLLEILRERGYRHEMTFVEHLKSNGFQVVRIDGVDITPDAATATIAAAAHGSFHCDFIMAISPPLSIRESRCCNRGFRLARQVQN